MCLISSEAEAWCTLGSVARFIMLRWILFYANDLYAFWLVNFQGGSVSYVMQPAQSSRSAQERCPRRFVNAQR